MPASASAARKKLIKKMPRKELLEIIYSTDGCRDSPERSECQGQNEARQDNPIQTALENMRDYAPYQGWQPGPEEEQFPLGDWQRIQIFDESEDRQRDRSEANGPSPADFGER